MNKIIRNIVSIILCFSLSISGFIVLAETPLDYKCLEDKQMAILEQKYHAHQDNKICGCKTCVMDVMTFNGLFDYANYIRNTFTGNINASIVLFQYLVSTRHLSKYFFKLNCNLAKYNFLT